MRRIAILGSTGSIGTSTLDVIERYPGRFSVDSLASRGDWRGVVSQALKFKPDVVALADQSAADRAADKLAGTGVRVLSGLEGILEAATRTSTDIVVSSIVGAAGIMPTFAAVEAGKTVALANKEALVAAGRLITEEAKSRGVSIVPVDSEHSAVFQVLQGQNLPSLRKLILTASGGPFFGHDRGALDKVTPEMALAHPNWNMGPKVTVDSATMMNKGLEVIEAHWLFGLPGEHIEVMIHPQSIVHSMVEFIDGSNLAQLGIADMRIPISYALAYPERLELSLPALSLTGVRRLEFFDPAPEFFPCLALAYEALARGGSAPAVMNAANEVAVEAFLSGELSFPGIGEVVARTLAETPDVEDGNLAGILRTDRAAREKAARIIKNGGKDK